MRFPAFLLLLMFLAGCSEQLYRDGVESLHWPSIGEARYSLSIGSDSQVSLRDHRTGKVTALPFLARKLSAPITSRIRFSRDGRFLMVPVRKDDIMGGDPSYFLEFWDIDAGLIAKEVAIRRSLLDG